VSADWKDFLGRFKRPDSGPKAAPARVVVVGLGNPGAAYQGTRHNVGFEVIDRLATHLGIEVQKKKFGARVGEGQVEGKQVLLAKPQEFMNLSGQAVSAIVGFYRLPLDHLLVVADDVALEPGRIRLRAKGSAGGHNGLTDIIEKLKSQEFARLRIGIGSAGDEDMADYVLSRPAEREREILDRAAETAQQAALCWITKGLQAA